MVLGALDPVLGAALPASIDALRVQRPTDDVVANTRKVLDTAATDEDRGVLLEIVAFTRDITCNFKSVR